MLLFSVGMVMGIMLIGFSVSKWLFLSLAFLVVVGGMNTSFMTLNTTLIQGIIPDEVRGRIMSLREVAFGLGPVRSLVFGAIAEYTGAPLALEILGGICFIIPLSLAILLPRVRKLE